MVGSSPQEWLSEIASLQHELLEAEAEIARHHRDFARISEIVEQGLKKGGLPFAFDRFQRALQEIQSIVG